MKCLTKFQKEKQRMLSDSCEWFMVAIATTCFDKFNMSTDETVAFIDNVKNIADSIVKGYTGIDDYKDVLLEEYNFIPRVSK